MLTYFNYAGLAPLPPASYWRSLLTPELLGNLLLPRQLKQVERLREKVANWLGCQPEQVAFVPSTSLALTIAANSLDWHEQDAVLYPEKDFLANVLPWQNLNRFQVSPIPMQNWNEPWPAETRMVSISTVDYATGIEQPWEAVVKQAHARNIWTCVDAVQSAGIKPCWVPEIDFWCAGTQKWLASGLGLCIMILSHRVLEQLKPPFPSWLGLNDPACLGSGLSHTARGWECGWVSPQALSRLEANLDCFEKVGWDVVTDAVKLRRDYLHEQLLEMGWKVVSCPKQWSGIVSFDPGLGQAQKIVEAGYKRRIITAHRGAYVRLSPHIFNSMGQLKEVSHWLQHCYIHARQ